MAIYGGQKSNGEMCFSIGAIPRVGSRAVAGDMTLFETEYFSVNGVDEPAAGASPRRMSVAVRSGWLATENTMLDRRE